MHKKNVQKSQNYSFLIPINRRDHRQSILAVLPCSNCQMSLPYPPRSIFVAKLHWDVKACFSDTPEWIALHVVVSAWHAVNFIRNQMQIPGISCSVEYQVIISIGWQITCR